MNARVGRATDGEIAIVGASASGLYTAYLLAREGREVTVYERASSLAPAPRTLIVTNAMLDYLSDLDQGAVVNQVNRYELYANGKVGEVKLGRPDLIVERSTLINELAEQASLAGAEIQLGYRFEHLRSQGGRALATLSNEAGSIKIQPRVLVGADGASSQVASAGGWNPQATVPLLQAIVRPPEDLEPETSRVWFVPDDTPYFYWLIPDTPGRAALGVIGDSRGSLRGKFDAFVERRGLTPLEYQAAKIPRYDRWKRVHTRVGETDLYLVGDAAAQVKVSTVGGLVTGFRGAIGVAERILGRSGRSLRSLRRELDAHLLVRKVVHGFGEQEYCRLLDLLNQPTMRSLHRHTRDEATSILWKVALGQPRLLQMSIRSLVKKTGARTPA